MSVYWIGRAKVREPDGYAKYGTLVREIAAKHPHRVLARAGSFHVLEGEDTSDRFVLLQFGSMSEAIAYYNSPEYAIAREIRQAASESCNLVLVEGLHG